MSARLFSRRGVTAIALSALAAGCGTSTDSTGHAGGSASSPPPSMSTGNGMPGMPSMSEPMPSGDGRSASASGFTLAPATTTLPAGAVQTFTFRITTAAGQTVTRFQPDQTKLIHFYLIRSDLTGFAHLHPSMSTEGTWSVQLPSLSPGAWRAYTQFITLNQAGQPVALVLSTPLSVPGQASTVPLPPPANTTSLDGYTLSLSGQPMTAAVHALTLTISRDGTPVTDLQPYLDAYAHLTAIHSGDLAFAHPAPAGQRARRPRRPDPDLPRRLPHTRRLATVHPIPDQRHTAHRGNDRARQRSRMIWRSRGSRWASGRSAPWPLGW
ncbi:MAG: hypothetical protein ACRDRS_11500 [Pseudonocardiaceae bacterium]